MHITEIEPVSIVLDETFTERMSEIMRSRAATMARTGRFFDSLDDDTIRLVVNGVESDWTIRSSTQNSNGSSYDFLLARWVNESLLDQDIYVEYIIRIVYIVGFQRWSVSTNQLTVLNLDNYHDEIIDLYKELQLKTPESAV
jgi:CYTH domain-containing protein